MGTHARIETGYVTIDARAWLEQRTAGPVPELTTDLHIWATHARVAEPALHHWADLVLAWRAARGFVSPYAADPDDPAVISHLGTRLDADLWIARMLTPDHGRIAVVQISDDPPVVYTDYARDTADWYDADTVDIFCPGGHGWTWRTGRELLDSDGSFTTLTLVFGPNLDAPFVPCPYCQAHQAGRRREPCDCDRSSWIICPTCAKRCDVELPSH